MHLSSARVVGASSIPDDETITAHYSTLRLKKFFGSQRRPGLWVLLCIRSCGVSTIEVGGRQRKAAEYDNQLRLPQLETPHGKLDGHTCEAMCNFKIAELNLCSICTYIRWPPKKNSSGWIGPCKCIRDYIGITNRLKCSLWNVYTRLVSTIKLLLAQRALQTMTGHPWLAYMPDRYVWAKSAQSKFSHSYSLEKRVLWTLLLKINVSSLLTDVMLHIQLT